MSIEISEYDTCRPHDNQSVRCPPPMVCFDRYSKLFWSIQSDPEVKPSGINGSDSLCQILVAKAPSTFSQERIGQPTNS